jgi:hypothetical protein
MRSIHSLPAKGVPALVGALVVVSLIGFYPSYFSLFPRLSRTGWEVHFHLATIIAWLALLVAQAWLATRARLGLHRWLGRLSPALVLLVVVGFALVTSFGQRRHREPALLGAAVFDGSLFLLFYILAIWKRKNAALHGRYMMLTAVAFINPALGRAIAPQVSVPFEFSLILTLLIVSRVKKWPSQPFLVAAIAYPSLLALLTYCSVVEPVIMERLWTSIWG